MRKVKDVTWRLGKKEEEWEGATFRGINKLRKEYASKIGDRIRIIENRYHGKEE